MTNEEIKELAREYIDNCTERAGFVILTENIKNDFIDLFVAGFMKCLELNKEAKWHDLRKDPTDVPKENVTVLLLTEVEPVTARYDNEYESFFRLSDKLDYCVFIAPMSYIAWCEIPKFEEK